MDNIRNSAYKIKNQSLGIKDINLETREVAMYLSHFGNIDADKDLLLKGCFKKSLIEKGVDSVSNRKIAFLRYHNWEMSIGKFTTLQEDDFGLFAVAKLGNSTLGNDAFLDYQDEIIREHSIGFKYIADKTKFIEDASVEGGGYFQIAEVALWEGSAVLWGANELTPVIQVSKGENKNDIVNEITTEMNVVMKSILNGKGTDERLYSLEMKHKFLTAQLQELALINLEGKKDVEIIKIENEIIIPEIKSFNWNEVLIKIN
jgi:HK97 family phage prohead protease